jgi:hypothetical protein
MRLMLLLLLHICHTAQKIFCNNGACITLLSLVLTAEYGSFQQDHGCAIGPHLKCGCAKLPKNSQVRLFKCSMKKLKWLKGLKGLRGA